MVNNAVSYRFWPGLQIRIDLMRIDPDPAFFLIADPDPYSDLVPDTVPGFEVQKFKQNCSWKFFIYIFLIKKCNLLFPRPPYRTNKRQEKPLALKREHPALQNMEKFFNFFLYLWVIFALLDPDLDPATQVNADPCGLGSTTWFWQCC
jgi:hypothetical protein